MVVYLNGTEVCRLKNGQAEKFQAPATAFELAVSLSNGFASNSIIVEEGSLNACYEVKVKSGLSSAKIEITRQ